MLEGLVLLLRTDVETKTMTLKKTYAEEVTAATGQKKRGIERTWNEEEGI